MCVGRVIEEVFRTELVVVGYGMSITAKRRHLTRIRRNQGKQTLKGRENIIGREG